MTAPMPPLKRPKPTTVVLGLLCVMYLITYVDRVRAPVLVLVGEHDTRCVPGQVYRYVRALKKAGGDVELYSYEQGHSSYVVDEEVREWAAVLEFLRHTVRLP